MTASAQGLDVSNYSGQYNWAEAKKNIPDLCFGIYRLTQGLGGGVHRRLEVARGVDEAHQEQVADRVPGEFARVEAMFEGLGQGVLGAGQRHQALAQVADGRHIQERAQPTRGTAVVGHRDDGGDVGVELAQRSQGHGGAVAASDGDEPHRAISRWKTEFGRLRRRRISSAIATERCRPPVQPIAMVR